MKYDLLKNGKKIGSYILEDGRIEAEACSADLDFQTRDAIAYGLNCGHSRVEVDMDTYESKQLTGKPEWN